MRAHTRLLTRAIEWENNGRDNSFVLRGNDLRTAEEWQVRAAEKEPKLTALQNEYILAGRRAATRRQRVTLGAVMVGLVVAVVLGVFPWLQRNEAIEQRNEAERQANIALARQLAAQSQLIEIDEAPFLERSILLATESLLRHPTLEADRTLRTRLPLLPEHVSILSHAGSVRQAVFSPDGERLATASFDNTKPGTVRVWEVSSGKEISYLEHPPSVLDVSFSPDGELIATASQDGTAVVWEISSGKEVARGRHSYTEPDVAFSSDSEYVATAGGDGTARIWEIASGEEVTHVEHVEHAGVMGDVVTDVVFSADGQRLATGGSDGTARVWEIPSGEELARVEHAGGVAAVAFSPDGERLATASEDDTAQVWYLRPEDLVREACSRLTRNLSEDEWQMYLGDEPYRKTSPNLPAPK